MAISTAFPSSPTVKSTTTGPCSPRRIEPGGKKSPGLTPLILSLQSAGVSRGGKGGSALQFVVTDCARRLAGTRIVTKSRSLLALTISVDWRSVAPALLGWGYEIV